ncbi:hypothetical protein GCM10011390_50200 [Aureimonas endophytica]|uniref:Uncharacterized protein n=1 Tax=Aureimonas endophytica TaxID=2027858 RepID=A0A917ED24_9HYPH|nr:hypothetical protein [Aureimonas endophytica]GGE24724.1 hypothetical protein GCM10011390_50200 [Aureimonas endophytica]
MGRSRYHRSATLAQYRDWGQIATVSCNLCRGKRHYLPADLIEILGDCEGDRVERRMRCETCDRNDYLHVRYWSPIAADDYPITIRRLERIETIRRPVWRDERRT